MADSESDEVGAVFEDDPEDDWEDEDDIDDSWMEEDDWEDEDDIDDSWLEEDWRLANEEFND